MGAATKTAGRREAAGEAVVVKHDGQDYTLPVELPFEVAARISSGNPYEMKLAIDVLLEQQADTFWQSRPSVDSVGAFVEQVLAGYGLGESQASSSS